MNINLRSELIWGILFLVISISTNANGASGYATKEFNDKESRVATFYKCALIGDVLSARRDIDSLVSYSESISGISNEHSKALKADALTWLGTVRPSGGKFFDYKGFWNAACAEPFERLNRHMASGKQSFEEMFPLHEVATEEQIRTAKCTFSAMSKSDVDLLLSATKSYIRNRDPIKLTEAYQIDSVPENIGRCMRVHAKLTTEKRGDKKDLIYFYEMTESVLRMILIIEVAKLSNSKTSEKDFYDKLYAIQINKNKDYYK